HSTAADGTYSITANVGTTITITNVVKSYYSLASGTIPASYTAAASNVNFTMKQDTFTVSGKVSVDGTGTALSGVFIYLNGSPSHSTAADGTYSITANVGTTITITNVVKSYYSLASGTIPASYTASASNVNFTMKFDSETVLVSGKVTIDGTNTGLGGVTITCANALETSFTTAADGTYTVTAQKGSGVLITGIIKDGYTLVSGKVPAGYYFVSTSDVNFTMKQDNSIFTVSGRVTVDGTSTGLSGVDIYCTGGLANIVTTAVDGTYSITAYTGSTLTINGVTKAGYVRASGTAPASYTASASNVDFTMKQGAFSVSGKVTVDGTSTGISGVTITCTGALATSYTTGADGAYIILANTDSAIVITGVSKAGYTLASGKIPSVSYTTTANVNYINVNFTMKQGTPGYDYINVDGSPGIHDAKVLDQSYFNNMLLSTGRYELSGADAAATDGWYYVAKSILLNGTLTISGNVSIIIADGCVLQTDGVDIGAGRTLAIYSETKTGTIGKLERINSNGNVIRFGTGSNLVNTAHIISTVGTSIYSVSGNARITNGATGIIQGGTGSDCIRLENGGRIDNYGSITSSGQSAIRTVGGINTLNNYSTGLINGPTAGIIMEASTSVNSITNEGKIAGNTAIGVNTPSNSWGTIITNRNGGTISGGTSGISYFGAGNIEINNGSGSTISGKCNGIDVIFGSGVRIYNSGMIETEGSVVTSPSTGYGIYASVLCHVTNYAAGEIKGYRAGIYIDSGVITNSGKIIATYGGAVTGNEIGAGIRVASGAVTITNNTAAGGAGLIQGKNYGIYSNAVSANSFIIDNTGTIEGVNISNIYTLRNVAFI
ncbi:MAG: hypothetical protein FWG96_06175, partial [Methanomassiliicoccaceae archaeon]|nr:hypothetical protein [Methanomassiliicoccaceae archaeon]